MQFISELLDDLSLRMASKFKNLQDDIRKFNNHLRISRWRLKLLLCHLNWCYILSRECTILISCFGSLPFFMSRFIDNCFHFKVSLIGKSNL